MGRDGWQISVLLPSDYKSDGTGSSRYRTFCQGNKLAIEMN